MMARAWEQMRHWVRPGLLPPCSESPGTVRWHFKVSPYIPTCFAVMSMSSNSYPNRELVPYVPVKPRSCLYQDTL